MSRRRVALGVVLVAVAVHLAALYGIPYGLMALVGAGVRWRVGANAMYFVPRPTADSRDVVTPSPDLLYSVCAFDLSRGPVRLRAELPTDIYASMSFFGPNTDNFAVLRPRDGVIDATLTRRGDQSSADGAARVEAPADTGIVLLRTLISAPREQPRIEAARRAARCAPAHR